jgi:hypothetical protein
MFSRLAAIGALCAGLVAAPAFADCRASDIKIKSWEWRIESDFLIVVGEAVNNCAEPASIHFQVVVRDAAGKVVDTDTFVSDGEDIPSGESSAFKTTTDWIAKGKTVELKVIEVYSPSR